jgi:imidazolonepropionase-like amidohydrolase
LLWYKRTNETENRLVRIMRQAGVGFMTGTEADLYYVSGYGLHAERRRMPEAGFSPLEALRAATLNPAKFLGKWKAFGTIAPGKTADLVLLDHNPLDDIGNTEKIAAVVTAGRYLDRSALDRLLASAAGRARHRGEVYYYRTMLAGASRE